MMRERDMLPLKRYLYTSFLFALEINMSLSWYRYVFVQQDESVNACV